MKKTLLGCALFGAMGLANVALAQDFDDRWYLTATGGLHISDSDRNMDDNLRYGIGVGKEGLTFQGDAVIQAKKV